MSQSTHATPRELRCQSFAALRDTWPVVLTLTLAISLISWLARQITSIPLLSAALTFLLSIPTMGMLKGRLEHLRGTPLQYDCFFSMFPQWTKVLCYELWIGLFVFLWMLPGLFVAMVGAAFTAATVVIAYFGPSFYRDLRGEA